MRFVSPHCGFHTLARSLPNISKYTDQYFFVIPTYELAKLLRTINESKTIPPNPKIAACPYFQNEPRIARITAHAPRTLLSQESTIASSTRVRKKTHAIQTVRQRCRAAALQKSVGCSKPTENPDPLCRDTMADKEELLSTPTDNSAT